MDSLERRLGEVKRPRSRESRWFINTSHLSIPDFSWVPSMVHAFTVCSSRSLPDWVGLFRTWLVTGGQFVLLSTQKEHFQTKLASC